VTTTTISDAQFEFASKRVVGGSLADLVTVLDEDYRDLRATYDKLVSIEMIEAVDWRQYDTFFGTCAGPAARAGPDGTPGHHLGGPQLRAGQEQDRLRAGVHLPGWVHPLYGGDHLLAPIHPAGRRRRRGHRPALRRDIAPLARQPGQAPDQ
jgi:Mycolic acid cyclopropane synthetase